MSFSRESDPINRSKLQRMANAIRKPTDDQIEQQLYDLGIRTIVTVGCTVSKTLDLRWQEREQKGELKLLRTNTEFNHVGIASGIFLGSGEIPLMHMQNSGFTHTSDGLISFATVYGIPILALVTHRGSTPKDDSEPHQATGERTKSLVRVTLGKENALFLNTGRGVRNRMHGAFERAREGGIGVFILDPDSFKIAHQEYMPIHERMTLDEFISKRDRIRTLKGRAVEEVFAAPELSRDEAIQQIVDNHQDAAIIFCNGFTARAAQAKVDRLGNFYNAGYMGGSMAIGWGMAISNPDLEVVVVDGDQNAEASNMKVNLFKKYPDNLHWYVLDNGFGSSVGPTPSLELDDSFYNYARVIRTYPDQPGEFADPRIKVKEKYFDMEEAKEMARRVGPLFALTLRFRMWVTQQTERNKRNKILNQANSIVEQSSVI